MKDPGDFYLHLLMKAGVFLMFAAFALIVFVVFNFSRDTQLRARDLVECQATGRRAFECRAIIK